ncbi:MAG: NADPH-dependent reductase [Frankiales bacterium]|nr:NADPH-dependent reductase [Frankiales bacterium]MCW3017233.1 NADPH-dependent reductase [Solirubrobacterales bacterium]
MSSAAVLQIVSVVGNPRAESRTHGLARALAAALVDVADADGGRSATTAEVDLAGLGPKILDWADADAEAATDRVLGADLLIVASPTYKATYSGLLKAFLDRIGGGALGGTPAIGVLLGGAADHRLAVDVHLTPLLLELGAAIPVRGLFVLEADAEAFPTTAGAWAAAHGPALLGR